MNRVPRLLLESLPPAGGVVRLESAPSHHVLRVLRATEGQALEVLDGHGNRAVARLESAGRHAVLCCEPPTRVLEPQLRLEAWLPLIKPERLEWAVEKLTELGAWRVVLYHSERTGNQKRPPDLARLGRIIDAALEQSGNPWRPDLTPPRPLSDLLEDGQTLVSAHPAASGATAPPATALHGPLALLAGPEGGFSSQEDEWVLKRSVGLVSLGPHVVRAETAIVALTGTVQALKSSIE